MGQLFDYQTSAVKSVLRTFEKARSIMLQMPTGTGKTHVFCEIIRHQMTKVPNKRILVLAHRKELIAQIVKRLRGFGIDPGILSPLYPASPECQVQVASVQKLGRAEKTSWPKNISLLVVDEAHHTPADTYRNIISHYDSEHTKLLGVTATPIRTDGFGFKGIFEELICSLPIDHFIREKYLANYRHLATSIIDLQNIQIKWSKNGMDYDEVQLATKMSEDKVMADIVQSYKTYADGQKAILFAVNRNHSRMISERFAEAGISCSYIDSSTPNSQRDQILEDFKNDQIKVLCNVEIFTEGFDCPGISVVQLARPTKSLILYLQMIGRVLRTKADGSDALILDNAMLYKEHGLISRKREWTLAGVEANVLAQVTINESMEVSESPVDLVESPAIGMQEVESSTAVDANQLEITLLHDGKKIDGKVIDWPTYPLYHPTIGSDMKSLLNKNDYTAFEVSGPGLVLKGQMGERKTWKKWKRDEFSIQLMQDHKTVVLCDFSPGHAAYKVVSSEDSAELSLLGANRLSMFSFFFHMRICLELGSIHKLEFAEKDSFSKIDFRRIFQVSIEGKSFKIVNPVPYPLKLIKEFAAKGDPTNIWDNKKRDLAQCHQWTQLPIGHPFNSIYDFVTTILNPVQFGQKG